MPDLRLAFFSPFNPQKSGVSDYSEELLPHLAERAEVELVTGGYTLANDAIVHRFRVRTAAEFLRQSDRYDGVIYQLANSFHHHAYMLPCIEKMPGVSVFHDYYLHFLMLGLTVLRGDRPALETALRGVHGARARSLSWRLLFSLEDPYNVSMVHPLVQMSRAIVTHSQIARRLILKEKPSCSVRVIPMGMPKVSLVESRASIRRKHGFRAGEFVLASVSTASHTKRIEIALGAMCLLKPRHPRLRLLILGGGRLGDQAHRMIRRHNLEDAVRITGWTDAATYLEFLAAADAAVDLRYPSGAETSASLLRALSAGRPAIVSAQGSFLELPDEFTIKVPVGAGEMRLLADAVELLIEDAGRVDRMSEAALRYARSQLSLNAAAAAYIETVRAAQTTPAPESVRMASGASPMARRMYSALYKVFRLGRLYRDYGLAATLARIRLETQSRRPHPDLRMRAGV